MCTNAAVLRPNCAMESTEDAGIATAALAAIAASRFAFCVVSVERLARYTGVSTSTRVVSTAAALTIAIFQRRGRRDRARRSVIRAL